MSERWSYTQNKERKGPVSAQELQQLAASGTLKPTDLVWKKGMPSWLPASQVKGLFPLTQQKDLPPLPSDDDLPPLPDEEPPLHPTKKPDSKRLRIFRSMMQHPKRLAIAVASIVVVVSLLLAFGQQIITALTPKTQTQLLAELDGKITKWKTNRDKLKHLLDELQKDKTTALEKLDQLGVKSDSDIAGNPKVQVLVTELKDNVKQMAVYDKKYQEYDLAILKNESRVRNISHQLAAKEAGVSDADLNELSRSMASLDESLALEQKDAPLPNDFAVKDELARYRRENGGEVAPAKPTLERPVVVRETPQASVPSPTASQPASVPSDTPTPRMALEASPVPAKPEPPLTPLPQKEAKLTPEEAAKNRNAAEWAMRMGGKLQVQLDGEKLPVSVDNAQSLPTRAFSVVEISIANVKQVSDSGLRNLADLKSLTKVRLFGTPVTDAGLVHLKGLQNLRELNLAATKVTGKGLAHIRGCRNLETLYLGGTQVHDVGLIQLQGLDSLTFLGLDYTQVTDAGVRYLAGLKNLKKIRISGTKMTEAAVRRVLPNCEIVK